MRSRLITNVAMTMAAMFVAVSPAIGSGHKLSAGSKRKIDPTAALALMLEANSLHPGEDVAQACKHTNFKGLSYALTLNASWLARGKQEFESSDEYKERADKLSEILSKNPILICQPLAENEDAPFTYSADAEEFSGTFEIDQNVWRDTQQLGRFRGKTALGITFMVSASHVMEYNLEIALNSHRKGCLADGLTTKKSYVLKVPRTNAPNLKATGHLVYVGKLAAPYINTDRTHDTASLDDPNEVVTDSSKVFLALDHLQIIDGSGKIWWSCDPKAGPGASPPQPKSDPLKWVQPSDDLETYRRPTPRVDVGYELKVNEYGMVMNCSITKSSGDTMLDSQTCSWLSLRAQIAPATDDLGSPVDGVYAGVVHWAADGRKQ